MAHQLPEVRHAVAGPHGTGRVLVEERLPLWVPDLDDLSEEVDGPVGAQVHVGRGPEVRGVGEVHEVGRLWPDEDEFELGWLVQACELPEEAADEDALARAGLARDQEVRYVVEAVPVGGEVD